MDSFRTDSQIVVAVGDGASIRFLEFFAATIRNPHTRLAHGRAMGTFLTWCEQAGVPSIAAVQPLHVANWIALQDARAYRADRQAAPCGAAQSV